MGMQLLVSLLLLLSAPATSKPQLAPNRLPDLALIGSELEANLVPSFANGTPTAVYAGLYVEAMGGLSETDMVNSQEQPTATNFANTHGWRANSISMDVYFRLSWTDPRLAGQGGLMTNPKADIGWKPDIYFPNAKRAEFHKVTVHNFALFIEDDGLVSYSTRLSLIVACPMNLLDYPMDTQRCPLKISSYANAYKDMPLKWFPSEPIESDAKIELPEFSLASVNASYCDPADTEGKLYTYRKTHRSVKQDKFGCLEAHFYFERNIGYHFVQTFLPTSLVVAISWVGFWIDPGAVPARVSLSFTTLLTLTTMGTGLRFSLPKVSYAKAIDYWFLACMAMVFGTLLEFAACNSMIRKSAKLKADADATLERQRAKMQQSATTKSDKSDEPAAAENGGEARTALLPMLAARGNVSMEAGFKAAMLNRAASNYVEKASRIDFVCRFLFPLTWLIFNLFYWGHYKFHWF